MIDVHYWPTPNGQKVTIMLEEIELPYRVVPININRGDQFAPAFLAISPNNRMPAIVDHEPPGGGGPLSVFESGAILMYLADKSGKLWPREVRPRYEVAQWVFWQAANQGPKLGENGHFKRAAQDPAHGDVSYARRRFDDETNRIYGVMNNRLRDRRFLAGDSYTIADVICYPWAATWKYQEQNLDEFPHVRRWLDELAARPAVVRGMAVGKELREDPATISPDEQARRAKVLHNQRARPAP
ncbi:MAG TPA: glutathione binding-like protein [Kofleriaceae bacterium]|nr:glutathione binding-like protein [Kofleriaceae bacterium]